MPLYIAQFTIVISNSATNPVISLYALSMGATISIAAIVVGAPNIITFLTQVPFGFIVDKLGRNRLLYVGAFFSFLGPLLGYLAPDVPTLILTRLIYGFSSSVFLTLVWIITMDLASKGSYGRASGTTGGINQLGGFLGPLIGGAIAQLVGYRQVFLLSALMAVPSIILTHLAVRRLGDSLSTQRTKTKTQDEDDTTISTRNFLAALFSIAIAITVGGVLSAIIPIYLVQVIRNTDVGGIGILLATAALGQIVVRVFLASLSDIYGRRKIISAGLAIVGIGSLTLLFRSDFPSMIIMAALIGVGTGFVVPAAVALITESVPKSRLSTGMGAFQATYAMGFILGTTGVGFLVQSFGFSAAFAVATIIELGGSVGFFALVETKTIRPR